MNNDVVFYAVTDVLHWAVRVAVWFAVNEAVDMNHD